MPMRFVMEARLICVALFLALALPASAQTAQTTCNRAPVSNRLPQSAQILAARGAMRQACAADLATYCQGVSAACGMRQRCLEAHSAQLSPACNSAWQYLRTARLTPPR